MESLEEPFRGFLHRVLEDSLSSDDFLLFEDAAGCFLGRADAEDATFTESD